MERFKKITPKVGMAAEFNWSGRGENEAFVITEVLSATKLKAKKVSIRNLSEDDVVLDDKGRVLFFRDSVQTLYDEKVYSKRNNGKWVQIGYDKNMPGLLIGEAYVEKFLKW